MRLVKALIVLMLSVAVVLLVIPLVGKWYIKHWLEQQGYSPVIKQFSINYFLGRATLSSASLSKNGTELAGVFAMELDFSLPELLKGEWVLDKVVFDNLHFSVEKSANQWLLAGAPLRHWLGAQNGLRHLKIKRLEAANTDVCTPSKEQCLRVETMNSGNLAWQFDGAIWRFSHTSPVAINKVFLQDRGNASSVLYLDSLTIQSSIFANDALAINNLLLKNFQLIESQTRPGGKVVTPYQTQIGELQVGELAFDFGSDKSIRLHDVKVFSLRQALQRMEETPTHWLERMRSWFPAVTGLWQNINLSSPGGTGLEVHNLLFQGGRFTWRDDTVAPPAIESLSQIRFNVDEIDSAQPGRTNLVLEAKLGEIGALKFDSRAQFFSGAPLYDVTGYVHGLDLANFSGYSHGIFNQRVKSGVVDVSFNVGVTGGQVGGNSVWRLTGFATEAADAPMNVAFKKLADHNNSVEFELPIGLSVGADTRPVTALGRALNNTLTKKARAIPAAKSDAIVERQALNETLPPIYFASNEVDPAQLDLQRIPTIAARIRNEPNASLLVCPVATGGEWAAMFNSGALPANVPAPTADQRQRLLELSARRGQVLSRLLLDEGIPATRIIICGPSVDMTETGPSMATLAI